MSESVMLLRPRLVRVTIEQQGAVIDVPSEIGTAILRMARELAYGSVTIHFKAGQFCNVETLIREKVSGDS